MSNNISKIIALTGPAGAGKSTIAKALCKKFDRCVRIDIDRIKHFIESGFIYDETDAGIAQWKLLADNIIALARNFYDAGYIVIIEGYIDLDSPGWNDILDALPVKNRFLLLPSFEVLQKRDKQRTMEMQMGDDAVKKHHEYFAKAQKRKFETIDSSQQTANETVDFLYQKIV